MEKVSGSGSEGRKSGRINGVGWFSGNDSNVLATVATELAVTILITPLETVALETRVATAPTKNKTIEKQW